MTFDVSLLKHTFSRARAENGGVRELAKDFYTRLFMVSPALKAVFKISADEQLEKFMVALNVIVGHVEHPNRMLPYLYAMGIRHKAYGTDESLYRQVSDVLLSSLSEHLSYEGEWTSQMQQVWTTAMETVMETMIHAANAPNTVSEALEQAGYDAEGNRLDMEEPWSIVPVSAGF